MYPAYLQGSIFSQAVGKTSSLPKWSQQVLWFQRVQCLVTKNVQKDPERQVLPRNVFGFNELQTSVSGTLCSENQHTWQVTVETTRRRRDGSSTNVRQRKPAARAQTSEQTGLGAQRLPRAQSALHAPQAVTNTQVRLTIIFIRSVFKALMAMASFPQFTEKSSFLSACSCPELVSCKEHTFTFFTFCFYFKSYFNIYFKINIIAYISFSCATVVTR